MNSLIPDLDLDDDSPPEPRSRWSRRRGFYFALAAVTFGGLWGGWVWWYRADFPVPRSFYSNEFFAHFPGTFDRVQSKRIGLLRWKGQRRLRTILKKQSIWQEPWSIDPFEAPSASKGAELEFGAKGQFRWIQSPKALGKRDGNRDPIVEELH